MIATQHDDMLNKYGTEEKELEFVKNEIVKHVIEPVLKYLWI